MDYIILPTVTLASIELVVAVIIGICSNPKVHPIYGNAVFLWMVQVGVSILALVWFAVAGLPDLDCSPNCHLDLFRSFEQGLMIVMWLVQLASIVVIIVWRRRRWLWAVPIIGTALTIILSVAATFIADAVRSLS